MNSESVDLIYLDPPFNSNRDYAAPIGSEAAGAAFKDTWTLSDIDVAWIGLIAEKEPNLSAVIDAAGLSHGKGMKSYLVMMAVRQLEMRRLLKPTGSIYLHCDPTASHYLKGLMDTVSDPTTSAAKSCGAEATPTIRCPSDTGRSTTAYCSIPEATDSRSIRAAPRTRPFTRKRASRVLTAEASTNPTS